MKKSDIATWVAIGGLVSLLLGAGIWLGKLEQKVDDNLIYYHGTTTPQKEAK